MSNFWPEVLRQNAFRRPKIPATLAGETDFLGISVLCILLGFLAELLQSSAAREFTWSALAAYALLIVVARLIASIAARALNRPAIRLSIACTLMLAATIAIAVAILVGDLNFTENNTEYAFGIAWLIAIGLAFPWLLLSVRAWASDASRSRRFLIALLAPLACFFVVHESEVWSAFYYVDDYTEATDGAYAEAYMGEYAEPVVLDYDSEDLLANQDQLVDAQLAQLLPHREGRTDLYFITVAGDGAQSVFSTEAQYAQIQLDARFDTAGRSIALINDPDTLDVTPMATLRNLRRVLEGVRRRIDPAEDIVFLFLTSHGSADHQWSVQLGEIPLRQITPEDLGEAFDNAGIRWRITLISACYSGGFIDALAGDTSLVITASRTDRSSFGCGNDDELTYFGRAYFAQALPTTDDFIAAQSIAAKIVHEREVAEKLEASEPQISIGKSVASQLARWRRDSAEDRAH